MSVHAFDQYETLLGQGSVALELAEQAGELDTVLVPVGGGGLIAGMAACLAGTVRVVGVEPDGAPTLTCARAHGKPADAPAGSIAADALAPGGSATWCFPLPSATSTASSWSMTPRSGQRSPGCGRHCGLPPNLPPRSAVAALLSGAYRPAPDEHIAVVISGANMTPSDLGA